jgi:hypothetical protein
MACALGRLPRGRCRQVVVLLLLVHHMRVPLAAGPCCCISVRQSPRIGAVHVVLLLVAPHLAPLLLVRASH